MAPGLTVALPATDDGYASSVAMSFSSYDHFAE